MNEQEQQQPPTTHVYVVMSVVIAVAVLAFTGLCGTIYLCKTSTNPTLVAAAVKMIQTDPSSALAAYGLLRTDSAVIAIVAGLTGTALGLLGGILANTRTMNKRQDQDATVTREVVETPEGTKTTTTTAPIIPPPAFSAQIGVVQPAEVVVVNKPSEPVPTTEAKDT